METISAVQAAADSGRLVPLSVARKTIIPRNCSPATVWRWIAKGLEPAEVGGERIQLAVTYVGRTPHVTERGVREFFDRVTDARLAKLRRTQERCADVSDAELAAAGLLGGRT